MFCHRSVSSVDPTFAEMKNRYRDKSVVIFQVSLKHLSGSICISKEDKDLQAPLHHSQQQVRKWIQSYRYFQYGVRRSVYNKNGNPTIIRLSKIRQNLYWYILVTLLKIKMQDKITKFKWRKKTTEKSSVCTKSCFSHRSQFTVQVLAKGPLFEKKPKEDDHQDYRRKQIDSGKKTNIKTSKRQCPYRLQAAVNASWARTYHFIMLVVGLDRVDHSSRADAFRPIDPR